MAEAIAAPASSQSTLSSIAELRDPGTDESTVGDGRLSRAQNASAGGARQAVTDRDARRRAAYHSPLRGGE